jgi:hypothetical protein
MDDMTRVQLSNSQKGERLGIGGQSVFADWGKSCAEVVAVVVNEE